MALTRRLFKYHRFAMYHIAAIQIQWAWRGFVQRKKRVPQKSREVIAVEKIQRTWRSFTNVRIFRYYKDLINFKEKYFNSFKTIIGVTQLSSLKVWTQGKQGSLTQRQGATSGSDLEVM